MPKDIALPGDAFPAVADRKSLQFSGAHFCSTHQFAPHSTKIGRKNLFGKIGQKLYPFASIEGEAIFNCSRNADSSIPPMVSRSVTVTVPPRALQGAQAGDLRRGIAAQRDGQGAKGGVAGNVQGDLCGIGDLRSPFLQGAACHPREREDPEGHAAFPISLGAACTQGSSFGGPHVVAHWIPAFAGMTKSRASSSQRQCPEPAKPRTRRRKPTP